MSNNHSAFEKRYVDPKDQSDVEGLLEHFNLPPKAITFLRENKRSVQIVLAAVIIAVVSFSLYDSYREKRIESAASELTLALKETGDAQKDALKRVAEKYSGTASARWAIVELAHHDMKSKDFAAAAEKYSLINKEVDGDNPLYPLTLVGFAQAYEAEKKYDQAYAAFETLKDVKGYELNAYNAMARIHETKGEHEKALGIYGQFLTVVGDDPKKQGQKALVEAKIARIKARQ